MAAAGDGSSSNFNRPGGTARLAVFDDGAIDLSSHDPGTVTVGSLEGDGLIFLGANTLAVGSNNLSTTFSGLVQDEGGAGTGTGGTLSKVGLGVLTLSGVNLHTGGTSVESGTLLVTTKHGSGTGTGAVQVKAGTLGGSGLVAGAVTVGTGTGGGAVLAPAAGAPKQATFTTQSALRFKPDATFVSTFKAKGNKARSDRVNANGITIENGATFSLSGTAQGTLSPGLSFVVLSNTSAGSISGTFSNLPNGAIVTVNGNNFQASYSGGDGNDLTLTVVP